MYTKMFVVPGVPLVGRSSGTWTSNGSIQLTVGTPAVCPSTEMPPLSGIGAVRSKFCTEARPAVIWTTACPPNRLAVGGVSCTSHDPEPSGKP